MVKSIHTKIYQIDKSIMTNIPMVKSMIKSIPDNQIIDDKYTNGIINDDLYLNFSALSWTEA